MHSEIKQRNSLRKPIKEKGRIDMKNVVGTVVKGNTLEDYVGDLGDEDLSALLKSVQDRLRIVVRNQFDNGGHIAAVTEIGWDPKGGVVLIQEEIGSGVA